MPSEPQTAEPQSIGSLAADFAAQLGVPDFAPRGIDWVEVSTAYATDARLSDARARYAAFIATHPELAETDWTRPQYEANRPALLAITGWIYAKRGIVASGHTGRGKTRAIADLFRRLACDEGRDVRYYFAGDWFATLQHQVNYGRDEARGWVEACARRPIVILDDLGNEAMQSARAEWAQGWLFRFLDLRITSGLPLLVTTNLTSKQLAHGYTRDVRGDPLVRRLLDLCEPVKFQ